MATTTQSTSVASVRINMLLSIALLVVGFDPLAPELGRGPRAGRLGTAPPS